MIGATFDREPPPMPIRAAIILAAGLGTRLGGVPHVGPKALLEIGGETLIGRSARLLAGAGIERIIVVTGHEEAALRAFARSRPGVECVSNPDFATTGSMASLARGLARLGPDEDCLLLEGDLFYEARALAELLGHPERDVVLVSDPTGATDEVWVDAPGGWLRVMDKDARRLDAVFGELVGICRISAALGREMRRAFAGFEARFGHGRMCYETDALVEVAQRRPICVHRVDGLLWGEIDDAGHYERVQRVIAPRVLAGEGGG